MTLREFTKKHRAELDRWINAKVPNLNYKLNDKDRRDWILNDEGLYNWAREEGVRI